MAPDRDRRRLLVAAGGLALGAGVGRAGRALAAARPAAGDYPFALGVASGDPWPDGFVIWTRLAPQPLAEHGGMPMVGVPVTWEIAGDERFARILQAGQTLARPELGHSVHVEVAGLQPARPYWYRFRVAGADVSPVGRARTAPAAGSLPARLRLAVAGCQNYHHGWFEAWRHLSQEPDLDAVFHYGDYIYEGAGDKASDAKYLIRDAAGQVVHHKHVGGELFSLDDYRRRYAQYKSDADLQAAHASVAFVTSFDDHEVVNDYNGERDGSDTPLEVFSLRRRSAMQAWYENSPVRAAQFPRADGLTMYRRLDYGSLLRMHVLDTRSYRANQACDPAAKTCHPGAGVDSSIMGAAQESWLDAGLASDARWNLIAQQVFVMPLNGRSPEGAALPFVDKWNGFPGARARLVQAIRKHGLTNVVIATGDAHMNAIGTVPVRDEEPGGAAAATEFLATSISSNGDGALVTPAVKRFLDADNPFLAMCNDLRGYHTYDITAQQWRTDVKAMDQVQARGGKLSRLASFHVTPDKPQLHPG
ncbi:MAG: alkaline phosphatase D family protein [Steroidobacteraceae bacterium]